MKELLVISGKGGTGKTSLTASFAALANDVVLVDCDTDAANLHLMVNHQITAVYEFYGLPKVEIDLDKCQRCRRCLSGCTYQAIRDYRVDEILCEGCQVCLHLCPWQAISVKPHLAGHWYTADSAYGPFVYARLGVAEENSGKLVAEIRSKAKEIAKQMKKTLIISDGPPGIGCPVIAALSGVNLALIVTEPSESAKQDLIRVVKLANHFKIPTAVCINKYDLNKSKTYEIKDFCTIEGIEVLGLIPYDEVFNQAILKGKPVVEFSQDETARQVRKIWKGVKALLDC